MTRPRFFYVAQEIARLKEIPLETVIETTEQNAKDIYRIPDKKGICLQMQTDPPFFARYPSVPGKKISRIYFAAHIIKLFIHAVGDNQIRFLFKHVQVPAGRYA